MPMMIFVDDNKEIQLCEESNEAHLHTAYVHFFLRQLWKTLQTEEDHLQKRGTKWAETFTFLVCCYGSTYRVPQSLEKTREDLTQQDGSAFCEQE